MVGFFGDCSTLPNELHTNFAALFTGIKNAVLNNVDMVYTAKNSSESNPDYEYEQIKIGQLE